MSGVVQEWFLSDGSTLSAEEQGYLWNVPLMVASGEGIGSEAPKLVMMDQKTLKIEGVAAGGGAVLLNAGQQSLFRVNYGEALLTRLATQLDDLTAIDRASLISDNLALAKAGKVPIHQVGPLFAGLFVFWSACCCCS